MAAVSSVHNPSLNMRNPSVKRIMKEYQQFQEDPSDDFVAAPLEDNMFEWHFTIKGPPDSEFTGGLYHGRILLPDQYPFKPPDIMILTPNGRFETNTKICLSVTGFHPKSWQPSWGIRTVLLALSAFFPTEAKGAVGSLEFPKADRQKLAAKSPSWKCDICSKCNSEFFTSEALARPAVAVTSVATPPQDSPAVGPSSAASPFSVPATPPFPAVPSPQLDPVTPRADGLRQRVAPSPAFSPLQGPARPGTQTQRSSRNERLLNVLTAIIALLVLVLLARKFTRNGPSLAYSFSAGSE